MCFVYILSTLLGACSQLARISTSKNGNATQYTTENEAKAHGERCSAKCGSKREDDPFGMSFHTRQALKIKLREAKAPPKPCVMARKFVQNHSPKYRGRCSWCSYSMRHIQRPVVCCLVSWENIVNLKKMESEVITLCE